MREQRQWSDADRELVARTWYLSETPSKDDVPPAHTETGRRYRDHAAAVLDALAGSGRWLRIRVEDLDLPASPDDMSALWARWEAEWRDRGWAPVAETRRDTARIRAGGYDAAVTELRAVHERTGSPGALWAADYLAGQRAARAHTTTPTEGDHDAQPME